CCLRWWRSRGARSWCSRWRWGRCWCSWRRRCSTRSTGWTGSGTRCGRWRGRWRPSRCGWSGSSPVWARATSAWASCGRTCARRCAVTCGRSSTATAPDAAGP
ncbi:MAG: hypothetical protein AVDCRST_MAG41-1041, partial [uncultured Corynebacteriales bacterium]